MYQANFSVVPDFMPVISSTTFTLKPSGTGAWENGKGKTVSGIWKKWKAKGLFGEINTPV